MAGELAAEFVSTRDDNSLQSEAFVLYISYQSGEVSDDHESPRREQDARSLHEDFFAIQEQTAARSNRQFEDAAKVIDADVSGWIETHVRALQESGHLPDMESMSPGRQVPILRAMVETYDRTFLARTSGIDGKSIARCGHKRPHLAPSPVRSTGCV